jgi:hypothetical protein
MIDEASAEVFELIRTMIRRELVDWAEKHAAVMDLLDTIASQAK